MGFKMHFFSSLLWLLFIFQFNVNIITGEVATKYDIGDPVPVSVNPNEIYPFCKPAEDILAFRENMHEAKEICNIILDQNSITKYIEKIRENFMFEFVIDNNLLITAVLGEEEEKENEKHYYLFNHWNFHCEYDNHYVKSCRITTDIDRKILLSSGEDISISFTYSVTWKSSVKQLTLTNNSLPMKNAAQKGMLFPMVGLGTKGPGYQLGQQEECWYWPSPCCTSDYCPAVNSTRDFIQLANSKGLVARIDTGYAYGDNANNSTGKNGCPAIPNGLEGGHLSCNTMGIGEGIRESKAKRSDVFVTIKTGYAGPMGDTNTQITSTLHLMKLDYADLCLVHLPESGPGTGSHGQYGNYHCNAGASDYNPQECRVNTYKCLLNNYKSGQCRSVGVNNWNKSDVKELEDAGLELPSVVQYKFHLHQSTGNSIQNELMEYCQEKGIIFNGIAPLGTPDWVTFTGANMTATTLEEPKVKKIADNYGKSPAQVLQRWIIQQNIAIQTRSMDHAHMEENLDMFDWKISDEDMQTLSSFPQCHTQRGNPYMDGDPNGGQKHGNVIGMTQHC